MSRLYLSNPCAFYRYFKHTVLRAQSALVFPCALSSRTLQERDKRTGKVRTIDVAEMRTCARSETAKFSGGEPRMEVAGELGFEPRQTESESVVLPLHHSPLKALIK